MRDVFPSANGVSAGEESPFFRAFLSGKRWDLPSWRRELQKPGAYAGALGLVWAQGEKTFTLTQAHAWVNSAGAPFSPAAERISLAHPMELPPEETESWRRYFADRGIVQPFTQMDEPVTDEKAASPDRYAGISLWYRLLTGKKRHGIVFFGLEEGERHVGFTLADCHLDYTLSYDPYLPDQRDDLTFTFGRFTYRKYTRKVNHIVSILDSLTVFPRAEKDDLTVLRAIGDYPPEKLGRLIDAAARAGARNVLAALLDRKNRVCPEADPIADLNMVWE